MTIQPWRDSAACLGLWTEVDFFTDTKSLRNVRKAKSYCYRCPVRWDCLEYAVENNCEGIWGGTTDDERGMVWAAIKAGVTIALPVGKPLVEPLRQGFKLRTQSPNQVNGRFHLFVKEVSQVSTSIGNVRTLFTLHINKAGPSVSDGFDTGLLELEEQVV